MFKIDPETKRITMHRGDTGSVPYVITGYEFGENDRVLWTMKSDNGTEVKKQLCTPVDGRIVVDFVNSDTDSLAPGTYRYDIRIIANPVYDEGGNVVDGTMVNTPQSPLYIEILSTVGQI